MVDFAVSAGCRLLRRAGVVMRVLLGYKSSFRNLGFRRGMEEIQRSARTPAPFKRERRYSVWDGCTRSGDGR